MKKTNVKAILSGLLALLLITACWDNVELEGRGFVTAMAIDKNAGSNYMATLELPLVSNEKSVVAEKIIETNEAKSLALSIYGADVFTDKSIYLAHMKMAVLGGELLSDEKMMRQVADTFLRDRDVSRKLILLAAKENAADIMETEGDSEKLTGVYIANYYKKNNPSIVFRQDLDKMTKSFAEDGMALIPCIEKDGDNLNFSGAAVLRDYCLSGWLDEGELRGLLWVASFGKGAKLEVEESDHIFVMNVDKYKADMDFYEENGILYAALAIQMVTTIEEAPANGALTDQNALKAAAEAKVKEEINAAYDALYNKMQVDGFNMAGRMKKKQPMLYKVYMENMGESFMSLPVIVHIDLSISNTGSVN